MSLFGLLPQGIAEGLMSSAIQKGTLPGFASPEEKLIEEAQGYKRQPIGLPGMLGLKGKARDILGSIGDALLVANNQDPMYAPAKKREDLNEAMYGFADNPMEAIKKISQFDPQLAYAMNNEYQKQRIEAEKARFGSLKSEFDVREKVMSAATSLMNGANEATYKGLRERAIALGKRGGIDLSDSLPEVYSEEALNTFRAMGIDPDKYADNERDRWYKQERLSDYDISEARQSRNTASMIESRSNANANRNARTAQGAARTAAYVSKTRSGEKGTGATRKVAGRTFVEVSPGKWKEKK